MRQRMALLVEHEARARGESVAVTAARHGISRLSERKLLPSGKVSPAEVNHSAFCLAAAGLQSRISKKLEEQRIPHLFLKGLSTSFLLYEDFFARQFGDVDVMVAPENSLAAMAQLEEMGLRKTYPSGLSPAQQVAQLRFGKAQCLQDSTSQISVDLHWRSLSHWIGYEVLPFEDIHTRSQILEWKGFGSWRTLGPADLLVFLALHGAQDGWRTLKHHHDFCRALELYRPFWETALCYSAMRRPMLEQAGVLMGELYGVSVLPTQPLSEDAAVSRWLGIVLQEADPNHRLLAPSLMSGSWRAKVLKALNTLLLPAVDDIQSVRLPVSALELYRLARAVRLIIKLMARSRPQRATYRERPCS